MKVHWFRRLLEKIPPGVSISLPGVSIDPGNLAQYFADEESLENDEVLAELSELRKDLLGGFQDLKVDLETRGIDTQEKFDELLRVIIQIHAKTNLLSGIFLPSRDVLYAMLTRNFLFEYRGEQSDYTQLLSQDLRKLFYSLFNEYIRNNKTNRMVIMGREGSGKTFNSLLLALCLTKENHSVYYCSDVRHAALTRDLIQKIDDAFDEKYIFIIDNCHTDIDKAGDLVTSISRFERNLNNPVFIFLTRPLDKDTSIDIFGQNTPVISMFNELIDFKKLVSLFMHKLKAKEDPTAFLKRIEESKLSSAFLKYRNMEFWNEAFRSIQSEENLSLLDDDIFKRSFSFFQRHEQNLLDLRFDLLKMLPFFSKGMSLHLDYATNILKIPAENAQKLIADNVISIRAQDWEKEQYKSDSALFYTFILHPTKARILLYIYNKYYDLAIDSEKMIVDYVKTYPQNLYYVLSPIYDKDELMNLYKDDEMIFLTKEYFKERALGKKLDRIVRRLGELSDRIKDLLYDDEIIEIFANKINQRGPFIVSKLYLMRSLYKCSRKTTYEVFKRLNTSAIIDTFLDNPERGGIYSFSKWMEVLKNLYYYAETPDEKEKVREYVKEILDTCSQVFLDRFDEKHERFTQLHWLLKRLDGLHLANYFLRKIPPQKLVEFIRTKDINTPELVRYVIKTSKNTPYLDSSGKQRSYYQYLEEHLSYNDIKKVFDSSRSDLYDITTNSIDRIVTKALIVYVHESRFEEKVIDETSYLFNKSLNDIETNYLFGRGEKDLIIEIMKDARKLRYQR